jgi:ABC-2 type transport system ATP-binding protein
MTGAGAHLELQGVSKRHRRRGPWVLDGVSLTVEAGEVVQVAGTNGCGKSTLLRIAAGLQPPTHGRVRTSGVRRYVPEHTPVPPAITVRRYLAHQARLQGVTRAEVAAAVEATLARHDLGPAADRLLGRLSKGWGQRCILAQALAEPAGGRPSAPPGLVLLDEPWSGVDAASREHLLAVVADLAGRGAAVLLTSHEPVALPGMRRLELRGGRLDHGKAADAAPPHPVRTVTLVARAGAPPIAPALTSAAGVVSVRAVGLPADADADGYADADGRGGAEGQGDGGRPTAPGGTGRSLAARARLVVTADDDGDRVLVALLQRGWTIERLVPGEAP